MNKCLSPFHSLYFSVSRGLRLFASVVVATAVVVVYEGTDTSSQLCHPSMAGKATQITMPIVCLGDRKEEERQRVIKVPLCPWTIEGLKRKLYQKERKRPHARL